MLATKVVCPNCSRTLKSATPLPVGQQVLCRKCGTLFGVQADNSPQTPAPAKDVPVRSNKALLFGGILAAIVLLMVVGSAAAVAFAVLHQRGPTVAAITEPSPTPAKVEPNKPLEPDPPVPPHDDPSTPAGPEVWLPPDEQAKVEQTLEHGLAYIRKRQGPDGFWPDGGHNAGMAALPALTLLETGAPPDDPQVHKAAAYIRSHQKIIISTYDLSLCILFLDRLGDAKDKPLIRTLALRLIAGQKPSGGWAYTCPLLNDKDERDLLQALQASRPALSEANVAQPAGVPGSGGDKRTVPTDGNDSDPPPVKPADQPKPGGDGNRAKFDFAALSPTLKKVEALQPGEIAARQMQPDTTDNSNTQFAILAIWVAGRHGVPTERVGALIERRFRISQGTGGKWGYYYQTSNQPGSHAMTCAGLLGLAIGHGVKAGGAAVPKEGLDDEQIKKGFKYLGDQLGKPAPMVKNRPKVQPRDVGLYFLWSVERVAVMYSLRTIGDKDWYAWGAQLIVDNQAADGSISFATYPGETALVDTCFALLFLKRANLAKDLSTRIENLIDLKGVGRRH